MPIMVIISKSYKLIQASITKGSDKLQKKFMVPHFWGQKATKYKYFLDWFFFFLFYILGILLSQDWLCWFQHFNMQSSRVWGCAFWWPESYRPISLTSQVLLIFYSKSSENIDACQFLNLENMHALIDIFSYFSR